VVELLRTVIAELPEGSDDRRGYALGYRVGLERAVAEVEGYREWLARDIGLYRGGVLPAPPVAVTAEDFYEDRRGIGNARRIAHPARDVASSPDTVEDDAVEWIG
jgi:hypothetical protein